MMRHCDSAIARQARAVFFWAGLLLAGFIANVRPSIAQPVGMTASAQSAPRQTSPHRNAVVHARPVAKPRWSELTPAQQQALAPLASEWDKLDGFRKKKWLTIGNRFASLKPDVQQRLQERMRAWAKLTPDQRRIARESYTRAKRLNQAQKSAQWKKYQQLPEEQKKKLAADAAASRKHLAALPPPKTRAKNHKAIPPIRSAPKRLLEQSVTPQATNQSAFEAAPSPTNN